MKINEQNEYLLKHKIEINYDNYKKYDKLSNIFFFYSLIHHRQIVKINYSSITYNPKNNLFEFGFLVPCDKSDLISYKKIIDDVSKKDFDYLVSPEFMKILEEEECLTLEDPLKIKAIFTVQFINMFFNLPLNFGSYKLVYTIDNKFLFHIFNNHFCPILSSIEMLERKSFHIPNFYILEIPHIIIFKLNLIMEKENEFNLKLCTKNGTRVRVFNLMYQNLYYRLIVDDRSKRVKTFFIINSEKELYSLDKSPILQLYPDLYVLPFYKKAI